MKYLKKKTTCTKSKKSSFKNNEFSWGQVQVPSRRRARTMYFTRGIIMFRIILQSKPSHVHFYIGLRPIVGMVLNPLPLPLSKKIKKLKNLNSILHKKRTSVQALLLYITIVFWLLCVFYGSPTRRENLNLLKKG